MTVLQALLAFSLAAGLLTLTPGLDTALVLRTAASEGPRSKFEVAKAPAAKARSGLAWLQRGGVFNNLLNPKAGVFYVSFLPQFLPGGVPAAPFMVLLACLHALMGVAFFAVLIGATRPVAKALQQAGVVRWLDRITGGVFLGFGVRLALERR